MDTQTDDYAFDDTRYAVMSPPHPACAHTRAICGVCQQSYTIGDWPFCPHGRGAAPVITDTIIGGQVIETLDHEEMTFYSQKAIRDAADARGLRIKDEWAGPHDKQLTNWAAAIDPKTLENARILVTRVGTRGTAEASSPDPAMALQTLTTWTRTIQTWSDVE